MLYRGFATQAEIDAQYNVGALRPDFATLERELLARDEIGAGLDLDAVFDYAPFVRHAQEIVDRLDAIVPAAERAAAPAAG